MAEDMPSSTSSASLSTHPPTTRWERAKEQSEGENPKGHKEEDVGEEEEEEDKDDDDYLTMTFADPYATTTTTATDRPTTKETLTQVTKRKQREAEMRGRTKSKAELAAEEAARRDEGLKRSTLDPSNKGFQMMAKLGYKPGSVLGRSDQNSRTALLEPVRVEVKEGRGGIGADGEKKRKAREEMEARLVGEKKVKVEEAAYRERQRLEREDRRTAGQILGAQKVAESLEEEETDGVADDGDDYRIAKVLVKRKSMTLSHINVLWRGAVKQRALAERDKRMRHDVEQSLSRRPTYDDQDEDTDEKLAFGRREIEEVDVDLDEEDQELHEFEAMHSTTKLQRLVQYLRERWHYCFWCKYRYADGSMEGCPGIAEDDHD